MRLNFNFGFAWLFLVFSLLSCDEDFNQTVSDETDLDDDVEYMPKGEFVDESAMQSIAFHDASHNMMEVRLAEIAIEKTGHRGLRSFARMIKDDHNKALEKLEEVAEENQWDLPDELMEEHLKKVEEFAEIDSERIEAAYITRMIDGHEAYIKKVRNLLGNKEGEEDKSPQKEIELEEEIGDTLRTGSDTISPSGGMNRGEGSSTFDDDDRDLKQGEGQIDYGATSMDPALKTYLVNLIPVLKKHLEEAREMKEVMLQNSNGPD